MYMNDLDAYFFLLGCYLIFIRYICVYEYEYEDIMKCTYIFIKTSIQ